MSYVEYDVIVNKIAKADYDAKVASGEITQEMIDTQVWHFTDDQFVSADNLTKLAGIETGAQVNIIEGIHVNGEELSANQKIVNIVIPTKLTEFENDLDLSSYENVVERVTINGEDVSIVDKVADIQVHQFANQDVLDATSASFTTALKAKVDGVAAGAQVNVIEEVHVNGEAVAINDKTVDIVIPQCKTRIWN